MMKTHSDSHLSVEAQRMALRDISQDDFRAFGVNHIAYIRAESGLEQSTIAGADKVFAIYGVNGVPLAIAESMDAALYIARQNDLHPVIVQ